MKRPFELIGSLALVGTSVCWALIPVFLKELTNHVDAFVANGIRYPFAAMLYWPILIWAWKRGRLDRNLLRRAVVPALFSFAGQILWALAPYYLEASLIGFLVKASILWAVAGAMLLFPEERPLMSSPKFYLGLLLAVTGFVALVRADESLEVSTDVVGLCIILACSIFFGLYGVAVRHSLRGVNPALAFGVVAQFVAIGCIVLMFSFGEVADIPGLDATAWALLLGSACIGIGLSHVLYYVSLFRLGAAISTSAHMASPFFTLYLAYLFLGESMSVAQGVAGAVLIVGGLLIVLAQDRVVLVEKEAMRSVP